MGGGREGKLVAPAGRDLIRGESRGQMRKALSCRTGAWLVIVRMCE